MPFRVFMGIYTTISYNGQIGANMEVIRAYHGQTTTQKQAERSNRETDGQKHTALYFDHIAPFVGASGKIYHYRAKTQIWAF